MRPLAVKRGRLGILVGGGPAPGINSAISSVTIEASNSGLEVIGIYDGFEHLMKGDTSMVRPLSIADVTRIHFQGGSILRTSRAVLTEHPQNLKWCVEALQDLNIGYLVTIGGDGTSFGAFELSKAAAGTVRVVHIPKTIDNDIPLPGGMSTFGFETARHVGTGLVLNLMEDSRTTGRWFFVTVMGRKAGHLALGIGKSAGCTLTIIPEEFTNEHVGLHEIATILEGAILKRQAMGRQYGLAILAEGIGEKLDPEELRRSFGVEVEHDTYGHLRLGEIPLATILRREVQRRFAARGDRINIADLNLGYELRSAQPIPFDLDYTRTLGYGAVHFLLSEPEDERLRSGGLVCITDGQLETLPFQDIQDCDTGRTQIRLVDIDSLYYRVAREYMIRLEREDMEDPEGLETLAAYAKMTPGEFLRTFSPAAGLAS